MIVLDISRLLSRAGRGTPTGIDRVELAYAEHLIAAGAPLCFTAVTPWGGLALLPRPAAEDYVARARCGVAGAGGVAPAPAAGAPAGAAVAVLLAMARGRARSLRNCTPPPTGRSICWYRTTISNGAG